MEELLRNRTHEFGVVDGQFLTQPLRELNPAPAICVPEGTSVEETVLLMQRHRIGCLLVTDRNGALSGIFSERDLLLRVWNSGTPPAQILIDSVMTPHPHAELMTTSIAFALHLMGEGGYRHLPIVDESGQPTGIVSVKDIVEFIQGELLRQLVLRECQGEVQS